MNKLMLTKYGFVRSPKDDFSDDGNRFTGYRLEGMEFSYLRYDGEIYLSGHAETFGDLNHSEYSTLPCYRDLDKYNGVSMSQITEEGMLALVESTKAYIKAYHLKQEELDENNPTYDELLAKCNKEYNNYTLELQNIDYYFSPEVFNLNDYDLKRFKDNYATLKRTKAEFNAQEKAKRMLGGSYSRTYMEKPLGNSYAYETLLSFYKKLGIIN